MKFRTESGSTYLYEHDTLTRFNEHDPVNGDWNAPPLPPLHVDTVDIYPEVGSRALFQTEKGPLHTTRVTEIEP